MATPGFRVDVKPELLRWAREPSRHLAEFWMIV
jgi:hypothetical protein